MAHINGIAGAGVTEATRLAQTVLHREAEAGALVAAGSREDRQRAERLPEATHGAQIGDGEGGRGAGGQGGGRRRFQQPEAGPDAPAPTGHLIDLQA